MSSSPWPHNRWLPPARIVAFHRFVLLPMLLGWIALGGLRAESPGTRAFRLGEPVPLTRETPTQALQVGVEAPAGLEWKPVGTGAWVAARVVLEKPYGIDGGEFLHAYRPANDPKVAVLELVYSGQNPLSYGTIMMGRRREVDGTERPVRMYRTKERGLLAVCEPILDGELRDSVLYRFAVGEPGQITLPLIDGRLLSLKRGDFAAERGDRLEKLAARIDPAKGGPDWSAINDDLVLFLALEQGFESMAGVMIHGTLEPLLEPLAADLAAESPAAEKSWREFVGRVQKLRAAHKRIDPRSYGVAWHEALVAGGIAERGKFERLGRRGLRAAPAPNPEAAEKLIALWREADRTEDHERLLALRAQWRAGLKDKAALAALDQAIMPVLRREIARLHEENENPGTAAGLAFLAYQLGGGGPPPQTTLGALTEPAPDDSELNFARWYARVVLTGVWPALAADHPESPRLVGFLHAHPDFAGNPAQAMLGLRPGATKEFSEALNRRPGRIPVVLAGPLLFLPAKDAPPIDWPMTFTNTDPGTSTDPLIRQQERVRSLRARPQDLRQSFSFWRSTYEGPRRRLQELAAKRLALEQDQNAAAGAAQKARQDWAAAQQWSWDHPVQVIKSGDKNYEHYVRGGQTSDMVKFEKQHDSHVDRAIALQGSLAAVKAEEAAAWAEARGSGILGSEAQLLQDLRAAEIDLAREEKVLERMEAAEARRLFSRGVGGHDERRLEALRHYVGNRVPSVVQSLRARPDSPARTRELQWWRWWLALDRADMGELPAELRPAGYWMPEIAAEMVAEELHGALGADEIGQTFKAAGRAIDRAIKHVNPLQLPQVLGAPLQAFRAKLTTEERGAFVASLDGAQQLVVTAALLKAAQTKP